MEICPKGSLSLLPLRVGRKTPCSNRGLGSPWHHPAPLLCVRDVPEDTDRGLRQVHPGQEQQDWDPSPAQAPDLGQPHPPTPPSQSPSPPEHWWGSAGAPGPSAQTADPARPSGGTAAWPGSPCLLWGCLAWGSPICPWTGGPRPLPFTKAPQSGRVGGETSFSLDPVNGGSQSCH